MLTSRNPCHLSELYLLGTSGASLDHEYMKVIMYLSLVHKVGPDGILELLLIFE